MLITKKKKGGGNENDVQQQRYLASLSLRQSNHPNGSSNFE